MGYDLSRHWMQQLTSYIIKVDGTGIGKSVNVVVADFRSKSASSW